MKLDIIKKIIFGACGVLAAASVLTACQLEPYEIPSEELYLRNFIKKYGLIDPEQDWNMAKPTTVTVDPSGHADHISVYVRCGSSYYRVADYVDVNECVEIPVDIPEGSDDMMVEVDGTVYYTTPGSMVVASGMRRAPSSRALGSPAWNASFAKPAINLNAGLGRPISLYDNAVINAGKLGDKDPGSSGFDEYIVGSTRSNSELRVMVHNNKAAIYSLYFKAGHKQDNVTLNVYLIDNTGRQYIAQQAYVASNNSSQYTLTREFMFTTTEALPVGDYQLVVTVDNIDGTTGYGGNWGYFTFNELSNMTWLIVAEDLGATDDFDFNDIIVSIEEVSLNYRMTLGVNDWQLIFGEEGLDIETSRAGETDPNGRPCKMLRVKAMAAGGILPLWLHYYNGVTDYIIGDPAGTGVPMHEYAYTAQNVAETDAMDYEWHKWFGFGHRTIINTGGLNGYDVQFVETESMSETTIYVNSDFTMNRYSYVDYDGDKSDPQAVSNPAWSWQAAKRDDYKIMGFYITIGGATIADAQNTVFAPNKGEAPQMFLIPDVGPTVNGNSKWKWPSERTNITTVYDGFLGWVANSSQTDWFLHFATSAASSDYTRPVD